MSEIVSNNNKYVIQANGGAIQSPAGKFVIKTQADSNVLINGSPCYFGDVEVDVPSGSTLGGATLTSTVTIKITATGNNITTSKGKALLKGDKSSGADTGTFQAGQTSTTVPITLVITDAGQTDVIAS